MKVFGDRLRELRNDKGLSCRDLAQIIGVAPSTIVFWENNKNDIKGEYIVRLSKYFGVTTDYLLGTSD